MEFKSDGILYYTMKYGSVIFRVFHFFNSVHFLMKFFCLLFIELSLQVLMNSDGLEILGYL